LYDDLDEDAVDQHLRRLVEAGDDRLDDFEGLIIVTTMRLRESMSL